MFWKIQLTKYSNKHTALTETNVINIAFNPCLLISIFDLKELILINNFIRKYVKHFSVRICITLISEFTQVTHFKLSNKVAY